MNLPLSSGSYSGGANDQNGRRSNRIIDTCRGAPWYESVRGALSGLTDSSHMYIQGNCNETYSRYQMTDRLPVSIASNGSPLCDFPPDFLLSIPLRKNNGETSIVEIVVTIIIINMITEHW